VAKPIGDAIVPCLMTRDYLQPLTVSGSYVAVFAEKLQPSVILPVG